MKVCKLSSNLAWDDCVELRRRLETRPFLHPNFLLTSLGAKSLDIESRVNVFKNALFAWPDYDKELSALSVHTTRKYVKDSLSHRHDMIINLR